MKPVRVGIIGCGVIANGAHLPGIAAADHMDLVAVCDIVESKAAKAAADYPSPKVYTNAADLIADDDVEAIIFALPTGVRTPLVYRALEKGKHVLVEKPSASSVREIDRFAEISGDSVVAFCSSRFTFTDSADAAAEIISSGELGVLREVRCRAMLGAGARSNNTPPPWRQSFSLNGGGILTNWGCYDIDYLLWVVGDTLKPTEIFAQWWPVAESVSDRVGPEGDADSHYAASIRCEGNILLSVERAEFSSLPDTLAWTIIGDKGSLSLDMLLGHEKKIILNTVDPDQGLKSEVIWKGTDEDDITVNLHKDFASAIRKGTPLRTGLEKARIIQAMFDGIYLSARTRKSVTTL